MNNLIRSFLKKSYCIGYGNFLLGSTGNFSEGTVSYHFKNGIYKINMFYIGIGRGWKISGIGILIGAQLKEKFKQ